MSPDEVRGEVFGPMSFPYKATLSTVHAWPKHGVREVISTREHRWWSDKTAGREALAEYIASKRRETMLGDGSLCITYLCFPDEIE